MTGAAIPSGCDCCVRQEDTDYGEETVQIYKAERQWGNYCFRGEDFKAGQVLLKAGTGTGLRGGRSAGRNGRSQSIRIPSSPDRCPDHRK